jgi:hypothetical protein
MKKSFSLIIVLLICISVMMSYSIITVNPQKPKITGTWNMSVETSAGSGTPTFVLKQEGDTLITGTYSGQLGEAPVKGTIKGNDVRLEFNISGNLIEYTGTVDGDNMKGRVKLGTMAEGTFTGKRKEGNPASMAGFREK